jgi:hypothetical protein
MDQVKVNSTINEICHDGCEAVNAVIEALEHDRPPAAMRELNQAEQKAVLRELTHRPGRVRSP